MATQPYPPPACRMIMELDGYRDLNGELTRRYVVSQHRLGFHIAIELPNETGWYQSGEFVAGRAEDFYRLKFKGMKKKSWGVMTAMNRKPRVIVTNPEVLADIKIICTLITKMARKGLPSNARNVK